jgi:hypothetical protein
MLHTLLLTELLSAPLPQQLPTNKIPREAMARDMGKISRRQFWRAPFKSWSHVSHRIHLIGGTSLLSIIRSQCLCFR